MTVGPVAGGFRSAICKVGAEIGLVHGKALSCAAVGHTFKHTCHFRVVGFLPALTVCKRPVGVAQPEKGRAVGVGEKFTGLIHF